MSRQKPSKVLTRQIQTALGVAADGIMGRGTNVALRELAPTENYLEALAGKINVAAPMVTATDLAEPTDQPAWLEWALSHTGEKEDAGAGNNPFILDLWTTIGIKWTHTTDIDTRIPWCAALIGAGLEKNGYKSTRSGLARSYMKYGVQLTAFKPGCILVWPRGNNPRSGHVDYGIRMPRTGIVETIGGNVKDSICITRRPIAGAIAIRYPGEKDKL